MGVRVLVVDDTLEAVQLLGIMLQSNGYEPLSALNYKKALRLAKEEKPAVALIDMLMPDMDGLELTRRLRADPETENMALIIVTALNEKDVESRIAASGADDMLYKPIDIDDLMSKIEKALEQRGLN